MNLNKKAIFLLQNLDLPAASGVETAQWEHFQIALWCDNSMLRIDNKSRQIAWSFAAAADGLADAYLTGRDSVFVSINQEEAGEKIRYAKAILEYLDIGSGKLKLVRDATFNMELSNGARLTSLTGRAPRGRPRANVYLDEFAHVQKPDGIFTATMPIISKGGRLRIGSSPFGAQGKFWEVFEERMGSYPDFKRKATPWWEVRSFCKNVKQARIQCPKMTMPDAVEVFANDRMKIIFNNMVLEDFEQEYCCLFNDTTTAWFTYGEIAGVQEADLYHERAVCRGQDFSEALLAITRLMAALGKDQVEPVFALGMDVGRVYDTTDIAIVGIVPNVESYPLRLSITLHTMPFDEQFEVLCACMTHLPIARALIDRNGIGMQLAENAAKAYVDKAYGVTFSNPSKALWATSAKQVMQQGKTPIPFDKDFAYQLHSIKRMYSGSVIRYDAERTDAGHADKAWAWMLAINAALQLARPEPQEPPPSVSVMHYA